MLQYAISVAAVAALTSGEIFGDLRQDDKYVAGAKLQLTCGADVAAATTDSVGSFRIKSKASGKCALAVTQGTESATLEVVVFEKPMRYRLVLEKKDGKLILKRV